MQTSTLKAILVTGFAITFGAKAWACPADSPSTKFTAGALQTAAKFVGVGNPGQEGGEPGPGIGPRTIVGLWDTKFLDNTGALIDEGYETFNNDGTELMIDTSAPATDNVCNGVWIQAWPAYKLKHVAWSFDASGNLLGKAVFRTTMTLDAKGTSFTGTSQIFVYDLSGNLVYQATATVKGTRITVDF